MPDGAVRHPMPTRPVYRHAQLARLLNPRTVAIVGASPRTSSFGERTQRNMAGFDGQVFFFNAKYPEIDGHTSYASVSALPVVPDRVVIATAREHVEAVARECAGLGVGGVAICASVYAETGKAERLAEQQGLTENAQASGMRIVGPNCIGNLNYRSGLGLTFTTDIHQPKPNGHAIGLVSQSGALGIALAQAVEHGTAFSHMLTSGNSCHMDVSDYVSYLADVQAPSRPHFLRTALIVAGLSLTFGHGAQARDYPTRPIRLIVPFAAGGAIDVAARAVATGMAKSLGQPVGVDNKPGAAGALAADLVAKSAPDGDNICFCATGPISIIPLSEPTLSYDPVAAGTPPAIVSAIAKASMVAVKAPEMQDKLRGMGLEPIGSTPKEYAEALQRETAIWSKVLKEVPLVRQ